MSPQKNIFKALGVKRWIALVVFVILSFVSGKINLNGETPSAKSDQSISEKGHFEAAPSTDPLAPKDGSYATSKEDLDRYYESAKGKTGLELKNALNDIIDDHKTLTYKEVWEALANTDRDPHNPGYVILFYTGRSHKKEDHGDQDDQWNREHIWAKSHGGFDTRTAPGTDLHHIRPTDVSVNRSRSNKDFDESPKRHSEAKLCAYGKMTFEPPEHLKGDVARMLFYMAVRYEGENGELDLELTEGTKRSKRPIHGKLSTLLDWHKKDPVSEGEKWRNEVIYRNYQGNRNPFIDHPEWVMKVFSQKGSK